MAWEQWANGMIGTVLGTALGLDANPLTGERLTSEQKVDTVVNGVMLFGLPAMMRGAGVPACEVASITEGFEMAVDPAGAILDIEIPKTLSKIDEIIPLDWDAVVPKKGPYKGQIRADHIRLHNIDNPSKPKHGVFYGDGVDITNEAWEKSQRLGLTPDANGVLDVPMNRIIGRAGGQAVDTGELISIVEIVVIPGTNKLITAYPFMR